MIESVWIVFLKILDFEAVSQYAGELFQVVKRNPDVCETLSSMLPSETRKRLLREIAADSI
jgi:hypothetical protein